MEYPPIIQNSQESPFVFECRMYIKVLLDYAIRDKLEYRERKFYYKSVLQLVSMIEDQR